MNIYNVWCSRNLMNKYLVDKITWNSKKVKHKFESAPEQPLDLFFYCVLNVLFYWNCPFYYRRICHPRKLNSKYPTSQVLACLTSPGGFILTHESQNFLSLLFLQISSSKSASELPISTWGRVINSLSVWVQMPYLGLDLSLVWSGFGKRL